MKSDLKEWLVYLSSLSDEEYAHYVDSDKSQIPSCDSMPYYVDYSTRGPDDYVISGPLGNAVGRGRRFNTLSDAFAWAQDKYGKERVKIVRQPPFEEWPRWVILVKSV